MALRCLCVYAVGTVHCAGGEDERSTRAMRGVAAAQGIEAERLFRQAKCRHTQRARASLGSVRNASNTASGEPRSRQSERVVSDPRWTIGHPGRR